MNQMTAFKSIAEEYAHKIWNEKDLSVIDDLIHPEIVIHSLLGDYKGTEPMKKVVEAWLIAFPDLVVKNRNIVCQQDLVVIQWEAQGTHLWEFKGIAPTNKRVVYEGVTIYKVCNSKIIEYWAYLDMHHLLEQIKQS